LGAIDAGAGGNNLGVTNLKTGENLGAANSETGAENPDQASRDTTDRNLLPQPSLEGEVNVTVRNPNHRKTISGGPLFISQH